MEKIKEKRKKKEVCEWMSGRKERKREGKKNEVRVNSITVHVNIGKFDNVSFQERLTAT